VNGATNGAPTISVIVPVRDNARGIEHLLARLAGQTLARSQFEVVIGDDGSQDGSLEAVETGNGWIRVAPGPPRTSYAARNRAARLARGSVLAFCDSDCLPEATWLEEGLAALERADVVAGEVRFDPPERPTAWSLLSIELFLDQRRNVLFDSGATANLFVARGLFDELGGFDESLPSGGDFDFVQRSVSRGARLAYASDAAVHHPTLDTARALTRKIWFTSRWSAARQARAGQRPDFIGLTIFIPILGVAIARRRVLRSPWALERRRLDAAGLAPHVGRELRALSLLYLFAAYVGGVARVGGWREGRRLARERPVSGAVG
jgi:glycosyltransferase involved in cell wall biosynthesis